MFAVKNTYILLISSYFMFWADRLTKKTLPYNNKFNLIMIF